MRWLVVVLTLGLSACMGPDGPMTEADSKNFMTGCLQSCTTGNCYPLCLCVEAEASRMYTRHELIAIGQQVRPDAPHPLSHIRQYCLAKESPVPAP